MTLSNELTYDTLRNFQVLMKVQFKVQVTFFMCFIDLRIRMY